MSPSANSIQFGDNLAVTDQGSGVIRVDAGASSLTWSDVGTGTVATLPSYDTSLPVSPTNGQEAFLVDSTSNPTYTWRFRYNANSSSPYKWEFVGGSPFRSYVNTAESAGTLGAWVELATLQRFQASRAGEYYVRYGCHFSKTTAVLAVEMQMGVAVSSPTVGAADFYANDNVAFFGNMHSEQTEVIGAGQILKLQFRTFVASGGNTYEQRYMTITPVRVS